MELVDLFVQVYHFKWSKLLFKELYYYNLPVLSDCFLYPVKIKQWWKDFVHDDMQPKKHSLQTEGRASAVLQKCQQKFN